MTRPARQPGPPRLASWLLRQAIPSATRDAVIGDLDEEFVEDVLPRLGSSRARRWYWRQAFSLVFAFGSARLGSYVPAAPAGSRSDSMRQDFKDALRTIVRSPSYSIVTIAVLALGIGATSAIFSFVDGVLLRPLPYEDPDRIVMVWERPPGGTRNAISTANYLDWQRSNDVFETMAAVANASVTMSSGGEPMQIRGGRVGAGYFDVFGARAALGRTFAPDEDQPGKDKVVVITHRLWMRLFAADPGIIGRDRRPRSANPTRSSASCRPEPRSIAAGATSGGRCRSDQRNRRGISTGSRRWRA